MVGLQDFAVPVSESSFDFGQGMMAECLILSTVTKARSGNQHIRTLRGISGSTHAAGREVVVEQDGIATSGRVATGRPMSSVLSIKWVCQVGFTTVKRTS